MPITYKCKNCGFVLATFIDVTQTYQGAPTPMQLIKRFRGRCPKCGHDLSIPTIDDIVIKIRTRGEKYEEVK